MYFSIANLKNGNIRTINETTEIEKKVEVNKSNEAINLQIT